MKQEIRNQQSSLTATFFTLISWGTITKSRQTRCAQTSLDFYCSSHSFAKILNVRFRLANCSISLFKYLKPFASTEKWLSHREATIWQSIFLPSFFCASTLYPLWVKKAQRSSMQCWWVSWHFPTKGIGTTNTFSLRYARDNVGLCVFAHTKKCI